METEHIKEASKLAVVPDSGTAMRIAEALERIANSMERLSVAFNEGVDSPSLSMHIAAAANTVAIAVLEGRNSARKNDDPTNLSDITGIAIDQVHEDWF